MSSSIKRLKCPNCGAPLKLAESYFSDKLTCEYCNTELAIPRSAPIRVPSPPVIHIVNDRTQAGPSSSDNFTLKVIGAAAVFFVIGLFFVMPVVNAIKQKSSKTSSVLSAAEPQDKIPERALPIPAVPDPPQPAAEPTVVFDRSGASYVFDQLGRLNNLGCKKVLLPASTVTGAQEIETKLIAHRGCVHIIAATGDVGNPLDLYMRTPSGEEIEAPRNSREIHFVYCPKKSGKYPLKIVALESDLYTIGAVECAERIDD